MVNTNPTFLDRQYGVVVGAAKDVLRHPTDASRYEIRLECDATTSFRVSLRVASRPADQLLAWYSPDLATVTRFNIPALAVAAPGFRALETGMQVGEGLDYLRDDLFPLAGMQEINANAANVSLTNLVGALLGRAINSDGARLAVFGQAFQDLKPDRIFHYKPAWGMHDVHMMQGNAARAHDEDNRVYGDGAFFAWFPRERQIAALFLRFHAQALATDEKGSPANATWQRN